MCAGGEAMSEGWKCPNCGGAHGPHVDSCPVPPKQYLWGEVRPSDILPRMEFCGCPVGTVCGNVCCPHATKVTC